MKTANFTTAEDELKILCIVVSPLQQQVESMLHHRGYLGHGIDIIAYYYRRRLIDLGHFGVDWFLERVDAPNAAETTGRVAGFLEIRIVLDDDRVF